MNIIVCIKQVPDTADIKWTKNNTLQREGVESIINPLDLYALNLALSIKENYKDVTISVITMGPLQAKKALKKAISLGADKAFLLSDKKFAASDTYSTAKIISKAIKEKFSNYDLIICGQYAIDGDTAQTGPSIAANLDIAQVTYVKEIKEVSDSKVTLKREVEDGCEIVSAKLPALLCVIENDKIQKRALISDYIKAHNTEIELINADDINLLPEEIGLKGSPTYVSKSFKPEIVKNGEIVQLQNLQESVDLLLKKIEEYKS